MLKAAKKNWADHLFYWYIRRQLKKNFSAFHLTNSLPEPLPHQSLLITPNHISWWDGFFIYYLQKQLFPERQFYILMLEEQLKKYPFFQKLGAFSINPENWKSILESFVYIKELSENPENIIVFYPQGTIAAYEKVILHKGLQFLLKRFSLPSLVWPIAFRIQFENQKQPALYCRFGPILNTSIIINDFTHYKKFFTENLESLNESTYLKKKEQSFWSRP